MAGDAYRKEPEVGSRGYPVGILPEQNVGPFANCAIGFCPMCGANSRRTTAVRGIFDCPECTFYWYDARVGDQYRQFEDYFSGSAGGGED